MAFLLLEDIFKEFCFHLKIKNYTPRTIKGYRNNNLAFIRYLKNEFEITELEEVKTTHVKAYLMFLKNKGRKESYVNTILKNIRAFYVFCVDEEYVTQRMNPCNKVKWMRMPKTVIKTFNDKEIKNMIDHYPTTDYLNIRNKLILMTFVDCGIRCLELCQLTTIDVMETTMRINGKGNKERYVYISPLLKKYMIKYERIKEYYFKDKIMSHNNYFLSQNGKPLTVEAIERVVKIAGEKTGVRDTIRCSPHTIRHYFAIKSLQSESMDIYSLSRLLGHENLSITKVYLQSLDDEKIVDMARSSSPLMNL